MAARTLASSAGMSPSNDAATNAAAYIAWRGTGFRYFQTLVFDEVPMDGNGATVPYLFPAETLSLQKNCRLLGYPGATLKCDTEGAWFVGPMGGYGNYFIAECLSLDGAGLVDYVVRSAGTYNSAGPSVKLESVALSNALVACFGGFHCYTSFRDVSAQGAPVGLLYESCSESVAYNLVTNLTSDAAVRIVGKLHEIGTETLTQPNGGRMSIYGLRSNVQGSYGLDLRGVAQTDVHGFTCEGASVAAIRIRDKSTNVWVFGARSNSGRAVVFDGCHSCVVYGGCVNSQRVEYLNGTTGCRAFLVAEDHRPGYEVAQDWITGGSTWTATVRPDGVTKSASGAPTAGTWRTGDRVGAYQCTVEGYPGTWIAAEIDPGEINTAVQSSVAVTLAAAKSALVGGTGVNVTATTADVKQAFQAAIDALDES